MSEEFSFAKELSVVSDPQALRFIERLACHFNERIQKLEEEVASLKRDSSTSSKPPSSDISYTELVSIEVSRGMLCNVVTRVSEALEVPYKDLKDTIPQQKHLNIDETGWRDSGKGH